MSALIRKCIFHFPDECFYIDYLTNPLPALAVLIMALNDHWWKQAYPSWLTGKISDFMGVFYFPIFLCALACLTWNFLVRRLLRSRHVAYISPGVMIVALSITAILMAGIKLSPHLALVVQTTFSEFIFGIRLTPDPTDLIAFLSLPLSYAYAKQFFNQRPRVNCPSRP